MSKMPITISLFVLASASAHAEQQSSSFQSLDADGNGYVSQTEAASNSALSSRWNELDQDKNNMLDMSEFSAFEMKKEGTTEQQAPSPSMPGQ